MNGSMLRTTVAAAALLGASVVAAQQAAPAAPAAKPREVPSEVTQWKGVVFAVDDQNRILEVSGPHGNPRQFSFPKGVQHMFNVKMGDTVTVNYSESVVIALHSATAAAATAPPDKVTLVPAALPAISDVAVKVVNAKVTAVNPATRVLSFADAAGQSWSFKVAPGVTEFANAKVGDQIVLQYTETTAITVTK